LFPSLPSVKKSQARLKQKETKIAKMKGTALNTSPVFLFSLSRRRWRGPDNRGLDRIHRIDKMDFESGLAGAATQKINLRRIASSQSGNERVSILFILSKRTSWVHGD